MAGWCRIVFFVLVVVVLRFLLREVLMRSNTTSLFLLGQLGRPCSPFEESVDCGNCLLHYILVESLKG